MKAWVYANWEIVNKDGDKELGGVKNGAVAEFNTLDELMAYMKDSRQDTNDWGAKLIIEELDSEYHRLYPFIPADVTHFVIIYNGWIE